MKNKSHVSFICASVILFARQLAKHTVPFIFKINILISEYIQAMIAEQWVRKVIAKFNYSELKGQCPRIVL